MSPFTKPDEGSWTEHYPELGTGPVSYEDSISPEHYELERDAIFRRTWLNVGRVEQLPKKGSYFTKELDSARTSVIVVRDTDGEVRAFHNICRHRGNKLVWNDFPKEEVSGTCRQFTCKYHGWRYGLEGQLTFVQQEGEFFDAPVLHAKQATDEESRKLQGYGYEALAYDIDGPHSMVSSWGGMSPPKDLNMVKPSERVLRSGLFGPWDAPDIGELPPGLNPAGSPAWG